MPLSVFAFVWRFSRLQQVRILVLSVLSFPILYLSLEVPKLIVNDAIGGGAGPREVFGHEVSQLTYLWVLSGLFLLLILFSGGLKYVIQVYKGVIAERMLRRLRYMLLERILRFPLPRFRTLSQGQTVSMISQESEPLGGFFGDSFALPVFQGGILLTILTFMFMQDPFLGMAAIALYPVQVWLIPKLQRKVNRLNKERVKSLRHMSDRIGETVSGAADIRANNTERYELASFTKILSNLFFIRFDIYLYKFLIKFLNNFFAQLTPFFFYAIGGYLVIRGDLSIGALVAVLAAYKDIYGPWKELLTYYQSLEDARVRYAILTEQFAPPDMLDDSRTAAAGAPPGADGPTALRPASPRFAASLDGTAELAVKAGTVEMEDGTRPVDGATLAFCLDQHVALVGHSGSGRPELAQVIAGLLPLTRGTVTVGKQTLQTVPPETLGRMIAYVDQDTYLRAGTLAEALYYGLKRAPTTRRGIAAARTRDEREAALSGNSLESADAPWLDPEDEAAGDPDALTARALEVLRVVDLHTDLMGLGMRSTVNPQTHPDLAKALLRARHELSRDLAAEGISDLVERFHPDHYIRNATLAENLMMGSPDGDGHNTPALVDHPAFEDALRKTGLMDEVLDIGLRATERMVELFQDLPPGHEFFDRYAFFDWAALDEHKRIIREARRQGIASLANDDQAALRRIALGLTPAVHRLGLITEDLEARVVAARPAFRAVLTAWSETTGPTVHFFDPDHYNPAAFVACNVLFGRIIASRHNAVSRVGVAMGRVLERNGLSDQVALLGLGVNIGVAGRRLTAAQRQKLAIARGLMKRPRLMVINGATGALDTASRRTLANAVATHLAGRGLVWADSETPGPVPFDVVFTMENGRVAQSARPDRAVADPDTRPSAPPALRGTEDDGPSDDASSELAEEAAFLKRIPFFSTLDRHTLKLIAFTSGRVAYRRGDVLIRQGEASETVLAIVEGTAEVVIETDTAETFLAEVGAGELIGEIALLCDSPHGTTVRAKTNMEAMMVSRDTLFGLIDNNPRVGALLTRSLAERVEITMRRLVEKLE